MNQKPINSPSKPRVSKIVLCVRASILSAGGRIARVLYVQFIADERQWRYEPDARDEAEDFSDQCVKAAEDKQAAENRGTNIAAAEDRGWVAALHDSMTARRGVYGHAQYSAASEYCLYGRMSERANSRDT
jgi:hypothetical protein